ncbi:MAG: hypothetical protein P4L76_17720 [Beijerinckiaceae bacterium]|nr:hypothetical protein [Beijerinckiaceae bacterium]
MLRSDGLVPLNGGAYQARDAIANWQVCENLFPEVNPQEADAEAAVTHYPREGLRPLSAPPAVGLGRGVFTASNGQLYAVAGTNVYYIDTAWAWHLIGQIAPANTPTSLADNGTNAVLVDGSPNGYQISLADVAGTKGVIVSLGAITPGAGGANATYAAVALTGGSGAGATANITVAGGVVTEVDIVSGGDAYLAGDVLSAVSATIGNVVGFSIPVVSVTAFTQIVDPTGSFLGSRRADFSDTFLAFATPGTNEWIVSLSNQVVFNALVNAAKDSTPDPIQTLSFNLRQMWLLGTQRSEIWFLAGSTPFPYQEWPNVFIPYGCVAAYSLVRAGASLFWLSRNPEGEAIAVKTVGEQIEPISTRALEYEWGNYARIDDVIGGTYQRGGHTFVIFHFPTADRTWAYDLTTKQWHRRTWLDAQGVSHREKAAYYAKVGADGGYAPTNVAQDWQTGQIYSLDPKFYTDNGQPIVCRRSFPHIMQNMKEITHVAFVADFSTGNISGVGEKPIAESPWSAGFSTGFGPIINSPAPALFMRYSNDGGNKWSSYRRRGRVSSGNYRSMMRWRGLGMARDRVYEVLWSYPGESALQGAYVDPIEHGS